MASYDVIKPQRVRYNYFIITKCPLSEVIATYDKIKMFKEFSFSVCLGKESVVSTDSVYNNTMKLELYCHHFVDDVSNAFSWKKISIFHSNFDEICFEVSNWSWVSIDICNCRVVNRRRTITCTNPEQEVWRRKATIRWYMFYVYFTCGYCEFLLDSYYHQPICFKVASRTLG